MECRTYTSGLSAAEMASCWLTDNTEIPIASHLWDWSAVMERSGLMTTAMWCSRCGNICAQQQALFKLCMSV